GESRGRAAAGRPRRAAARSDRGRIAPGSMPGRSRGDYPADGVSRRSGPLGGSPHAHPRARAAARTGGDFRPHAGVERAGTACLAAPGARAGPRAEQLADADQIHRRQFGVDRGARTAARRLAGRYAPRLERDYVALRQPQPLHRRLRPAGETAALATATALGGGLRGPRGELRDAAAGAGGERAGVHHTGRSGSARTGADQPAAQRGGRVAGHQGRVTVGWRRDTMLEIWVKDEGPGLSSTANLFVPFFTTKPGGSGIGLVLSRQIAE